MFVSPSYALQLQAAGAAAQRTHGPTQGGDSPTSRETASTQIRVGPSFQSVNNVEFDSGAKRVIVRQIHASSGTVVSQYPNEAQLRIREYVATAEAAKGQIVTEKV